MPPLEKKLTLVILCSFAIGCVNLKHVSEFSDSSISALANYETLPTSFAQACRENCRQEHIANFNVYRTECDCSSDEKADSITRLIYTTSMQYFEGLMQISDNTLTYYETSDLSGILGSGNFGPVQLQEEDVKAHSKIATLVLRAFSDGYRRNRIKQYIKEADAPLQVLIHFLRLNLNGNLNGKLEVQKGKAQNLYFDLVNDKSLSTYERTKFAEDYFKRISQIDENQRQLQRFDEVLDEIAKGHQTLYANLDGLDDNEVKGRLARLRYRLDQAASFLSSQK
ncbi:hypothetical protein [Pseudozobellia thermophila]|uniref:Uncharacterized protein n=1 Tax=Pseudozobellia thermophila TaxID=192903 RepID=A0A1M6HSP6_9FLAO|nr:hypothetical protein [Pseudozobellia thermophila]SHJ25178.1 hypothetical protein SAMN04488513_103162 [Pseudozobellia thermophila]